MALLKQIFAKPVDRPIEGVIKADDNEHLLNEVEEYVLVGEVAKKIEVFFDAYKNYQGANGVWISGFFGSGKSHLLKMLALLLEDRTISGKRIADIFEKKIADEVLRADFKKALMIPSKSILFNIDQKADIISKEETEAILSVFVKVFNEMQGYYPKLAYIANFERDIDRKGLLQKFKAAYLAERKTSWEEDRDIVHTLENETFAKVYSAVANTTYDEALKILDRYRSTYRMSIEDFANLVKEYIDRQPPGFRLNFFVDEVGQFIADNSKLMVNLQTIAESLATKCKGQAWILVTSQEDMSTVIGDLTKKEENDFSRIQARFKTKINLTSADVAEVIQKRLLEKNEVGEKELANVYAREKNNFGTLFHFADGAQTHKGFKDESHFEYCYPFIPYQFTLFQQSIIALSRHNAFTGKHASVGERSMLGVFQDVAKAIANLEVGQLATFDLMYEGLKGVLKGEHQTSINIAERNLSNPFAVKVLKALFLVKFVKEFKASPKNIGILLIDSFKVDLAEHDKKVREALNLLEHETYVQRNGDLYEFLTDDEKDIETEIKNTDVEESGVNELLVNMIFGDVLRDTKIRFEDNKQDYSFAKKLDSALFGRDSELGINIISPLNDNYGDEKILVSQSLGKSELLVVLASDPKLTQDLWFHVKTEKYVRQNLSNELLDVRRKILIDKATQNNDRRVDLEKRLAALLCKSKMFVNGSPLEISSSDAQTRLIKGFQELIRFAYPSLKMLRAIFKEDDISRILTNKADDLFRTDDDTLTEAEQEVLNLLQRDRNQRERTTLAGLLNKLQSKPYGWYQSAILSVLSKLYVRGKVEIRSDSVILDNEKVLEQFSNSRLFATTVIFLQEEFDAGSVRKLKDFHQEFFDEANQGGEAKDVALKFQTKLKYLVMVLKPFLDNKSQYPFVQKLEPHITALEALGSKEYGYYLKSLKEFEDKLLDAKDELFDPIQNFFKTNKVQIYNDIVDYLKTNEPNFADIKGTEADDLRKLMQSEAPYKGNLLQQAKTTLTALQQKVTAALTSERQNALQQVNQQVCKVQALEDFKKLSADQEKALLAPAREVEQIISEARLLPVIRDTLNNFLTVGYERVLEQLSELLKEKDTREGSNKPTKEFVSLRSIKVPFEKSFIETDEDATAYTEKLRVALAEKLKQNKKISL